MRPASLRRALGFFLLLTLILAGCPTGAPATIAAEERAITIATPASGALVNSPFTITGSGNILPFESTLAYRIYNAAEEIVGQGGITVEGRPDGSYTFAAAISFSIPMDGPGRVELVDVDESGDLPYASASIELFLVAGGAARACFSETNFCVEGRFLETWARGGGLAINGLPISDPFEQLLDDGKFYRVQYFERVRLEFHPANPPPYDVLLGQFGRQIVATVPDAPTARAPRQPGYTYFEEIGHNVGPLFSAFWQANGGLPQFGYPLTELFSQQLPDGQIYEVQYFERARFEYHPENAAPYTVLLGQFGRQILGEGPNSTQVITITTPQRGAIVGTTFEIRGTTSRIPFERNLAYWLTDSAKGEIRVRGAFLVEGAEGGPGRFRKTITLPAGFSGQVRLLVQDIDQGTGDDLGSATVIFTVAAGR